MPTFGNLYPKMVTFWYNVCNKLSSNDSLSESCCHNYSQSRNANVKLCFTPLWDLLLEIISDPQQLRPPFTRHWRVCYFQGFVIHGFLQAPQNLIWELLVLSFFPKLRLVLAYVQTDWDNIMTLIHQPNWNTHQMCLVRNQSQSMIRESSHRM